MAERRTIDGFRVPHLVFASGEGWGLKRIAMGLVYQGKRTVLGHGVWNVADGREIMHSRTAATRDKWRLPTPLVEE